MGIGQNPPAARYPADHCNACNGADFPAGSGMRATFSILAGMVQ